jgi:hypothetical protein
MVYGRYLALWSKIVWLNPTRACIDLAKSSRV